MVSAVDPATEPGQSSELAELYNSQILAFAANVGRIGRLPVPSASATARSPLCGSTVTIDIVVENGIVADFAHEVRACVLGQASSSIMAQQIIGASIAELLAVREEMLKMLNANGAPPSGRFADLAILQPVRDYRSRQASTMLTFDAVSDAISQLAE